MKHIFSVLVFALCFIFITSQSFAADSKTTAGGLFRQGIIKYKSQDYVGCMQTMQKVTEYDPGNALAHYYMAISYAQIGKKDEAINEYNNVLSLNPSENLAYYAQKGIKSIINSKSSSSGSTQESLGGASESSGGQESSPAQSSTSRYSNNNAPVGDQNNNSGGNESASVNSSGEAASSSDASKINVAPPSNPDEEIEQHSLDRVKDIININGGKINPSDLKKFKDYSNSKSDNSKPTGEEIANAIQILSNAGININQSQNSDMIQAMMLMNSMNTPLSMNGGMGSSSNAMNMMPMMLMMQGQNGNNNIDPQVMQNMITGMMMSGMSSNFNTDNNNNY